MVIRICAKANFIAEPALSDGGKALLQIGDDIIDMPGAGGETDRIGLDAWIEQFLGEELGAGARQSSRPYQQSGSTSFPTAEIAAQQPDQAFRHVYGLF